MFDWLRELPVVLVVAIFAVVIIGFCTLLWYTVFQKPIMDAKREAIKGSHGYVESNRSRILNYVKEYNDLGTQIVKYEAAEGDYAKVIQQLKTQRGAIVAQLREAVERMEKDQVPEGATNILKGEQE